QPGDIEDLPVVLRQAARDHLAALRPGPGEHADDQRDPGGVDVVDVGEIEHHRARLAIGDGAISREGPPLRAAPRTDPYGRNYRIGLLPRVLASKRTLGWGCTMRTGGSHRSMRRLILCQVRRCRWLRQRSARSQQRPAWRWKVPTASMLPGTA